MRTFIKSPLVRISFGLVLLTVSILLATDLIGLIPDTKTAELKSRKAISESLAIQLSIEIANYRQDIVDEILQSVVDRNDSLLSAAVRKGAADLVAEYGEHADNWTLKSTDKSTLTQVQVPIYDEHGRWGSVELRFTELGSSGGGFFLGTSFFTFILFMAVAGFTAYLLFLKRTMRELNIDAVIPERVRTALDTLAEGLLILDKDGRIIFSNTSFSKKMGYTSDRLLGKKSAELNWKADSTISGYDDQPWLCVLDGKELPKGTTVKLQSGLNRGYIFAVNASPITATEGEIRGVLLTLDDISEIEAKNEELRRIIGQLKRSKREVTRQNRELNILATRDPLTNTLNRRSLFQGFETLFTEAQEDETELSCIMLDIDHFKSVNDKYGHSVGDEVIKYIANILTEHTRPYDLVGRFGGEEFVVVLPNSNINIATDIAERMRVNIMENCGTNIANDLVITSSFGVSTFTTRTTSSNELLNDADQALYTAKKEGRNRVVGWSETLENGSTLEDSKADTDEQQLAEPDKQSQSIPETSKITSGGAEPAAMDDDEITLEDLMEDEPEELLEESYKTVTPNSDKLLLIDRLEQAIQRSQRYNTQFAVLVIETDAFQRINDTLGHLVGEKFYKIIINRLKHYLRTTDTVSHTEQDDLLFSISRFTGNEIVVLLTDLKDTDNLPNILKRIFSLHDHPIEVEGTEFYISLNLGISIFPQDGDDTDTLIKNAGIALRETRKNLGDNNFQFYSDDMHKRSKRQIRMDSDLHRALERDEFIVYYQPKVDLRSGTIHGMEALLRWQHPQLGIVHAGDFIPLAEQTGFIERISEWVINDVCRQIHLWQDAGFGTINVAINLSPMEFRNQDLSDRIIAIVSNHGIPPGALELEITETVVLDNVETAVDILEKLSSTGLLISLDDFGTGYSSLSYLRRFPLSSVKIDHSFISDFMGSPNDATIVNAIIAMGHSIGLTVVAEGVETEEQLRFLQDLQCDVIQGFLISSPLPGNEVSDLLADSSRIRHMVIESRPSDVDTLDQQTTASGFGIIGVLNRYPEKGVAQSFDNSQIAKK